MGFDTPNGTRGGGQPTLETVGDMNAGNIARIRAGETVRNLLILITSGRTSGQIRENPVAWFPGPDGTFLIVASAAGGSRHPGWYHNLGAAPEAASIVLEGRETPVSAQELTGPDREREWSRIKAASPGFAKYEEMTDREIPVIRLTPR